MAHPVVWWEIASPDAEATAEFCRKVFGWELPFNAQTGIFEQHEAPGANRFSGGGIFTPKPGGVEPHTTIYVAVPDVDEVARLALEAGGSVYVAPFDISATERICLVKDPLGVILSAIARIEPAGG
jgi:uncharacterized protein